MSIQLETFVKSDELVSFKLINQYCEETMHDYDEALDIKSRLEDLEAIICIGHACNRLASDIESIGTVDILMMIHRAKNLLYVRYDQGHLTTGILEGALAYLMLDAVAGIHAYCVQLNQ